MVEKIDNKGLYAMKQLAKDVLIESDSIECTRIEKDILRTSHHPFLVGLEYVFQTSASIYFVMKYYK